MNIEFVGLKEIAETEGKSVLMSKAFAIYMFVVLPAIAFFILMMMIGAS